MGVVEPATTTRANRTFHHTMTDRGFLMLPPAAQRHHIVDANTAEDPDRALDAGCGVLRTRADGWLAAGAQRAEVGR